MDRLERVNARCRQLPAVDQLVERAGAGQDLRRWSLLAAARGVLQATREAILNERAEVATDLETLQERTRKVARGLERPFPRRVINATGVVLHTNLGRAPLAPGAVQALEEAAGYCDLELDLEEGERGSRQQPVAELLRGITGAEAALVVNNNAAALLLTLDTLSAEREVVLSRGELIEIGGSFRLPEIMQASRARLREIGTTNRTHLRDYRDALNERTGLILKVHRSCFDLRGFVSEVQLDELAGLAREHDLPLVEDRGSATLMDLQPLGVPDPPAWSGLERGADLVLFSADKLLGGPQAGIILGGSAWIDRLQTHPLARALRVDKLTLAALSWTLRAFLEGNANERIPVLAMLQASGKELNGRAERIAKALVQQGWPRVSILTRPSVVGGGSLPSFEFEGPVVQLAARGSTQELADALRRTDPPVLARVQNDALLIDPRTLQPQDLEPLLAAFATLAR